MSTQLDTRDDHLTGLSTIEGIDLDLEVMCEGRGCIKTEHVAHYLVAFDFPCGHRYRGPRCATWWSSGKNIGCRACGCYYYADLKPLYLTIVEHLR